MRIILCLLCLLAGGSLFGQASERMKVTDLLNVKTAGSLTLSSDGSQAAFTVTAIEPDPENKNDYRYVTQLWLAPTVGGQARQATFRESSSQPAFSPDGRQLAFARFVEGKPQVFVLPLGGGEAMQITRFRYGASSPKWTPDGKLLFSASIPLKDLINDSLLNPRHEVPSWNYERAGFKDNSNLQINHARPDANGSLEEIRAYLDQDEKDRKAKVLTKLQFQEESTTSNEYSFAHIFITDAAPNSTPRELTHGFYSFSNPQYDAAGGRLIVDAHVDEHTMPDRALENQVYSVSLTDGTMRQLLGAKDMSYGSASLSPSGKWLAYLYGGTGFVSVPTLAVMPAGGSEKDHADIPFDRSISSLAWNNDESALYFTAQSNGGVVLCRASPSTREVKVLSSVDEGIASFALRGDRLAFARNNTADPSEVFISTPDLAAPVKVTDLNPWVASRELVQPEKHSFRASNGMEVEYWVMKPASYQAGKKYPLLLEIHGGPSAMWGPGEASMWHEFQYFCARGYGVVYCNPRGSGGYGAKFLRANVKDWGDGPTSDVLTALDKCIAEGWADTSRLLITGGSYAGYLTSWIIAHDHRFKAACSQRGVYELSTFFGEGNAWRLVPNYWGGYPWEPSVRKMLDAQSPLTYVKNITTPYIIFHGENDLRTGTIQGEMLYKSLKVLGRPVEYVRHPGATHEITRSGNNRERIDQMLRTYEFFERWIGQ